MIRVLIGGVGYRNLRDHSFGVAVIDVLSTEDWPSHVSVEDISYNPIAVVQRLQDDPLDVRFGVALVVGVLQRPGRPPGTLDVYRWNQVLPGPDAIHDAVTEAVTGIIALDNTLIVARHFEALPPTVVVLEVEPDAHEFGDQLTPPVAAALVRARDLIRELADTPTLAGSIPEGSLETGRVRHTGLVFAQVRDVATRVL